jgi:hypothetical protein
MCLRQKSSTKHLKQRCQNLQQSQHRREGNQTELIQSLSDGHCLEGNKRQMANAGSYLVLHGQQHAASMQQHVLDCSQQPAAFRLSGIHAHGQHITLVSTMATSDTLRALLLLVTGALLSLLLQLLRVKPPKCSVAAAAAGSLSRHCSSYVLPCAALLAP